MVMVHVLIPLAKCPLLMSVPNRMWYGSFRPLECTWCHKLFTGVRQKFSAPKTVQPPRDSQQSGQRYSFGRGVVGVVGDGFVGGKAGSYQLTRLLVEELGSV